MPGPPLKSRKKGLRSGQGNGTLSYSLHLQLGQALLDLGLAGRVLRQQAGQPHVQVLHGQLQLLDAALNAVMDSLGVWNKRENFQNLISNFPEIYKETFTANSIFTYMEIHVIYIDCY